MTTRHGDHRDRRRRDPATVKGWGAQLFRAREAQGLTLDELASKAKELLGGQSVSRETIRKYECTLIPESSADAMFLLAAAEVLGVPLRRISPLAHRKVASIAPLLVRRLARDATDDATDDTVTESDQEALPMKLCDSRLADGCGVAPSTTLCDISRQHRDISATLSTKFGLRPAISARTARTCALSSGYHPTVGGRVNKTRRQCRGGRRGFPWTGE